MNTLLIGATGKLGPQICKHLQERGHRIRALVRASADSGKRAALEACGAQVVEGDLKDAASLSRACAGMDTVISTATATASRQDGDSIESVDRNGQLALVSAARAAGVQRFVFVSFRDQPAIQFPLTVAKRAVEQAIRESGMSYTILQASFFMDVWLTAAFGFDVANRRATIFGDGTAPVSWLASSDVARAAATAVADNAARNETIELGGPEALSPLDVVRLFEQAGSGTIAVEHVPVPTLRAQLDTSTDSLAQTFAGLMLMCATGDAIDPAAGRPVVRQPMTTMRDYVASQLAGAGT